MLEKYLIGLSCWVIVLLGGTVIIFSEDIGNFFYRIRNFFRQNPALPLPVPPPVPVPPIHPNPANVSQKPVASKSDATNLQEIRKDLNLGLCE